VVQLIQDYEDYDEVNKELEKMGYNIGTRLIEDFLAKSNLGRCTDFRETGEVVAKVSMYFLSESRPSGLSVARIGWLQSIPEHNPNYYPWCPSTTFFAKTRLDRWPARRLVVYADAR
jgi:hypothetical protein